MTVITTGILVLIHITLVWLLTSTLVLLSHLEKLLRLVFFVREIIIGHDCKKGEQSGIHI